LVTLTLRMLSKPCSQFASAVEGDPSMLVSVINAKSQVYQMFWAAGKLKSEVVYQMISRDAQSWRLSGQTWAKPPQRTHVIVGLGNLTVTINTSYLFLRLINGICDKSRALIPPTGSSCLSMKAQTPLSNGYLSNLILSATNSNHRAYWQRSRGSICYEWAYSLFSASLTPFKDFAHP
jgi:hypothetical protein